jgi:hypothetical protein
MDGFCLGFPPNGVLEPAQQNFLGRMFERRLQNL